VFERQILHYLLFPDLKPNPFSSEKRQKGVYALAQQYQRDTKNDVNIHTDLEYSITEICIPKQIPR